MSRGFDWFAAEIRFDAAAQRFVAAQRLLADALPRPSHRITYTRRPLTPRLGTASRYAAALPLAFAGYQGPYWSNTGAEGAGTGTPPSISIEGPIQKVGSTFFTTSINEE